MNLVVLACLLAVAAARPDNDATLMLDEHRDDGNGNLPYNIQMSNGIEKTKTGTPGSEGQSNMQGTFRFSFDDGTFGEVCCVADESGYRPEFGLLPVGPELPEHVYELLRITEEQRAAGITIDRK